MSIRSLFFHLTVTTLCGPVNYSPYNAKDPGTHHNKIVEHHECVQSRPLAARYPTLWILFLKTAYSSRNVVYERSHIEHTLVPMKIVLISDLDGTLLHHDNYGFDAARPALEKLRQHDIPLVLASSKTGSEIAIIRQSMGMSKWPAIVENGGGVLPAEQSQIALSDDYTKLRSTLKKAPHKECFHGFGDMSAAEVAKATGLSLDAATVAKQRTFSEPGKFSGSAAQRAEFLAYLEKHGISATEGGRFYTLSYGDNKARWIKEITNKLGAEKIVVLGDAPNDREMLLAADYPVIIRNDHAPDIADIPGAQFTNEPSPISWNNAVLALLNKLLGI